MWRRNRDDRDVRYGRDERDVRERYECDYRRDYGRDFGRDFDRHRGQQMPDRADAGEEMYRRMRDDRGPFRGRDDYDRDFDRGRYGASRVERPDFYRDNAPPIRRDFNSGYGRDFDYERDRGEIRSDYRGGYRDRFDSYPGRGLDATPNYNSDRDRDYGFRGGEDRPRSWDWDRDRDRERERWDRDSGSEEWYRDRWRR